MNVITISLVFAGVACCALGLARRRMHTRDVSLAAMLDLPGEPVVDTVGLSMLQLGRIVEALGLVSDSSPDAAMRARRSKNPAVIGAVALVLAAPAVVITRNAAAGVVVAVAVFVIALSANRRRVTKRRRALEAQFPDALAVVAGALEAGNPLHRSLQILAESGAQPLAGEISLVVAETELGAPLVDAFDRMAGRVGISDVQWFARALRIQQAVGGQLAPLVRTVADVMTARAELEREARVLTAEGRVSAWVLGALPVLLVLACEAVNPDYLAPMFRGRGLVVLAGCAVSVALGIAWVLRMVDRVEAR
jgi:tight adherence protein B